MIFLIRLIQNAVSIYSIILVAFALLSWFPNAYESQLGRLVIRLARPVIEPLRKLNLQFAGLDWTILIVIFLLNLVSGIILNALLLLA